MTRLWRAAWHDLGFDEPPSHLGLYVLASLGLCGLLWLIVVALLLPLSALG